MSACSECLYRAAVLRRLAPYIDRSVDNRARSRARDLLANNCDELIRAVGGPHEPGDHTQMHEDAIAIEVELESTGCWSFCAHSEANRASGYPAGLLEIGAAAPHALFGRGDMGMLDHLSPERAVAIVGSRRSSAYGTGVAVDLARMLAEVGLTVVSGMAFGIDSAAHRGAVEAGGETLAVLAAGAERPYPRSRATLYRQIIESGAVISELPPGSPTFRWMFPARNRIIAALAGLTIVVEAAERSGSLITADMAADFGRTVGAVPGPVNSSRSIGANRLLAQGAVVIRDAQDALDALLGAGVAVASPAGPPVDPERLDVLAAVEAGAGCPDEVANACSLDPVAASMALTVLELDGYLSARAGGSFARTNLAVPDRCRHDRLR